LTAHLWTLFLYSTLLLLLGAALARRVKRAGDFFVASRRLGTGLLFSTLLAANIGAGSTVGAAGLGYESGLVAWWWVGSAAVGSALLAFTVGPRLWRIAATHGFLTVGDYLEHRYDRRVRGAVAILLWLGALVILAGQFIAIAWILNVVAQAPKWLGCLVGGIVVTAYFSAGGLIGVAWVNLVQVAVKLAGFLLAVPFALSYAGGWESVVLSLQQNQVPLDNYLSFTSGGFSRVFDYLILLAPSFLVSPGILQKVYGAREATVARNGVLLNAVCLFLFAMLPPLLGITARSLHPHLENRELALPTVMVEMLPPWLGSLALAAVFSAELSSADAVLAMLSTSFAKDFVKGHLRSDLTDSQLLRLARWVALFAGLLGIGLAVLLPSVLSALQIFYGLLTVALFVPLVFGLYWRAPNATSALTAIGAGVTATVSFQLLREGKGIGILSPVACGIAMAAAVMSFLTLWKRDVQPL